MTEGKVREDQGKRTERAGFTSIQTGVSHAVHDGISVAQAIPSLMCKVMYLLVSFQAQVSYRKAGIHRSNRTAEIRFVRGSHSHVNAG